MAPPLPSANAGPLDPADQRSQLVTVIVSCIAAPVAAACAVRLHARGALDSAPLHHSSERTVHFWVLLSNLRCMQATSKHNVAWHGVPGLG